MKKHVVKEYYTTALFALLKKKPYQDISISDLVTKSGASRASFYRNYESKDQIVDEYLSEAIGEIFRRHTLNAENMRIEVTRCFEEIYAQREVLRILANAGLLNKIDDLIYLNTVKQINDLEVLNNKYQPFFFAGASAALIKAWVQFDFHETPEEMSDIFFRSLSGYMTGF